MVNAMPTDAHSMTIRLTEVGPRDGLQNEERIIPTSDKIALVDALSKTGVAEIEVTSFVSPKWVPQLADAAEVFSGIWRRPGVVYSALVPNMRGLEAALKAGVDKVSVFTAASETFSRKNTNVGITESLERIRPVVAEAKRQERFVRGYISCVVECPYEGAIAPARVAEIAGRLLDLGVDEIDLGETIGVAVPVEIARLYDALGKFVSPDKTTLHMHDTRGTGLACILAAIEIGVRSFDCSIGGLGGCPYAPGAAGNIATEDVVYGLGRSGLTVKVDMDRLIEAGRLIGRVLGRPLPGRVHRAFRGGDLT